MMSTVIGGAMLPHAPQFFTMPETEDKATVEHVRQVGAQAHAPADAATDLMKPVSLLLRAYDDPSGVTAAFNKNLLARINRELKADFDICNFEHVARWDPAERRIEMHLRSLTWQHITIRAAGFSFNLREGETIWTESSHKYEPAEVVGMGERTGYRCDAQWFDREWPLAHSLFFAV